MNIEQPFVNFHCVHCMCMLPATANTLLCLYQTSRNESKRSDFALGKLNASIQSLSFQSQDVPEAIGRVRLSTQLLDVGSGPPHITPCGLPQEAVQISLHAVDNTPTSTDELSFSFRHGKTNGAAETTRPGCQGSVDDGRGAAAALIVGYGSRAVGLHKAEPESRARKLRDAFKASQNTEKAIETVCGAHRYSEQNVSVATEDCHLPSRTLDVEVLTTSEDTEACISRRYFAYL